MVRLVLVPPREFQFCRDLFRLCREGYSFLTPALEEPGWLERMMPEDLQAMTPLIYHHINPYGNFELDMAKSLPIDMRELL